MLYLHGTERAWLVSQQLDHPLACLGLPESGPAESEMYLVAPAQSHRPSVPLYPEGSIMRIILILW